MSTRSMCEEISVGSENQDSITIEKKTLVVFILTICFQIVVMMKIIYCSDEHNTRVIMELQNPIS